MSEAKSFRSLSCKLQAMLLWLPTAWAPQTTGGGDASGDSKNPGGAIGGAGGPHWSAYTVLLQWDPRTVVTPDDLFEWGRRYGEVGLANPSPRT